MIIWRANVNKGDWTALHVLFDLALDRMIQNDAFEIDPTLLRILKELLDNGADLSKRNEEEKTPLDSISTYSATESSFSHLKDCLRGIIDDKFE